MLHKPYIDTHTHLVLLICTKAGSATKSTRTLKKKTASVSAFSLLNESCDGHNNNLATQQASGISNHKMNLNPGMKFLLDKLHVTAVRMSHGSKRKEVLACVRKEHGRTKVWPVTFAARTRWAGVHEETKMASINQHDLDVAVNQLISYSGVDSDIYEQHRDNLSTVLFNAPDWLLIRQYECAMEPCRIYSSTIQTAQVFFHMELFESRRTLELMSAPW